MKQKDIIVIIAVAVVLGGLYLFSNNTPSYTGSPSTIEESQLPPEPAKIFEGSYTLQLYGGATDTAPRNVGERGFSLSYADGKLSGKICNSFSGVAMIADGKVKTDGLVSTKMACQDIAGTIETELFAALAAGADFSSIAEGLVLQGEGTLFVFEKTQ